MIVFVNMYINIACVDKYHRILFNGFSGVKLLNFLHIMCAFIIAQVSSPKDAKLLTIMKSNLYSKLLIYKLFADKLNSFIKLI